MGRLSKFRESKTITNAKPCCLVLIFIWWCPFAGIGGAESDLPTLKKIAEFDLPGPAGKRFDYLTVDRDDHYLLSAHLAAKQTYVIELKTNKVVATITDAPGAEGVEYVPTLLSSVLNSFLLSSTFIS